MMRSWAGFDSPIRDALLSIKYKRNLGLADSIAVQLSDFVRSLGWTPDLLTPVPSSARRLKERGYNQVALIAEPLAYGIGMRYAPQALRKVRDTPSQVGLNISQRRENVRAAYQADPSVVKRKSVLLMDDVATTGSTIASCTEALLSAGATDVFALTVARALSHHDLNRV
jgi:ComF family protein